MHQSKNGIVLQWDCRVHPIYVCYTKMQHTHIPQRGIHTVLPHAAELLEASYLALKTAWTRHGRGHPLSWPVPEQSSAWDDQLRQGLAEAADGEGRLMSRAEY